MIYFQPLLTEKEQDRDELPSFYVYLKYENVKADYPRHDIIVLNYNDVENPEFVDVNYGTGMNWDEISVDIVYFWAMVSQYLTPQQQDEIVSDLIEHHNRSELEKQ
jgi:hypothetical protein